LSITTTVDTDAADHRKTTLIVTAALKRAAIEVRSELLFVGLWNAAISSLLVNVDPDVVIALLVDRSEKLAPLPPPRLDPAEEEEWLLNVSGAIARGLGEPGRSDFRGGRRDFSRREPRRRRSPLAYCLCAGRPLPRPAAGGAGSGGGQSVGQAALLDSTRRLFTPVEYPKWSAKKKAPSAELA
jgi:hypothetical protein